MLEPVLEPVPEVSSRVRVVVVDDVDDMRMLLRMQFRRDGRFDVVGEGADGSEAIAVCEQLQPDLLVLDRQMPNLGGLEALPDIRRVSPGTAVVLYTAHADASTCEAAVDAGALDVLEKSGNRNFVDRLVGAVSARASAGSTMEISIGPVSSDAARVWVANSRRILEAAVAHPEISGSQMPADVVTILEGFLSEWARIAETTEEFRWVARSSPADVRRVIEHWAVIDGMSDEQLAALGVHWSPPEGAPFFEAVASGVVTALQQHDSTYGLAERLVEQFAPFRAPA